MRLSRSIGVGIPEKSGLHRSSEPLQWRTVFVDVLPKSSMDCASGKRQPRPMMAMGSLSAVFDVINRMFGTLGWTRFL